MEMSLGETAKLEISSDFGYGKAGAGSVIPADADLVFEVELLKINALAAGWQDAKPCCSIS
jgi:FK506-binding protein 1